MIIIIIITITIEACIPSIADGEETGPVRDRPSDEGLYINKSINISLYIYIYTHISLCVYIYIYIHVIIMIIIIIITANFQTKNL